FTISDGEELLMPLRWDAGKYKPPHSLLAPGANREELKKYFTAVWPTRFGSDWYITYRFETKTHYAYFPDNGKCTYLGTESIQNDYDGGNNFWPYSMSISGKEYISSYGPIYLKKKLEEGYFDKDDILYPDQNERLQTLIESLDENDNPLVRIITIKK
ncbi:MAG: hypothetical protein V2I37_07270, partial [Marinilabiliaceae bacterium]|nr:hypothetical protein [Marinilabiliaceae bacterium]